MHLGAHLRVLQQFFAGTRQHNRPMLEHVAPMRNPQGVVRILLNQQNGHAPGLVQLFDDAEHLADVDRCQAQRRLVQQQQLRPAHQRAGNRQHLLFAARQGPGALGKTLLQNREHLVHALEVFLIVRCIRKSATHLQVFQHRHALENAASFRYQCNAFTGDPVR